MTNSCRAVMSLILLLIPLLAAVLTIPAQEQERILVVPNFKRSTNGRAIEIVEIRVAGKLIEIDKLFTSEDDWIKYLVFKVKNISGKSVRAINMGFVLLDTKVNDKEGIGFDFVYGKPCSANSKHPCDVKDEDLRLVKPGEEVEVKIRTGYYTATKALAIKLTGVSKFNRVLIGSAVVQFEDGTLTSSQDLVSHNLNKVNQ